jgi:M6 family metalloprotease-like protein
MLVLLMQFPEQEDVDMIPAPVVHEFFNDDDSDSKFYPTGSLKQYLQVLSHHQLTIRPTVIPWFVVTNTTEAQCSFGNFGLDVRFAECFAPILDALDQVHLRTDNPFQWEDFDQNGDGFLDSLLVLHSGRGAEFGGESGRIMSHASGPPPQPARWQSSVYDVQLGNYAVTSVFDGTEGTEMARIGDVAHQVLHTLGLPDLYDGSKGLGSFVGGAGVYSVMSSLGGNSSGGHLDPWSKIQLGWVRPVTISVDGNYTLRNAQEFAEVFKIDGPFPEGEYLLIENRQQLLYDVELPGEGVLIWHIDEEVEGNDNAGYPGQEGWPENGNHYQVAVIQADGLFDLEKGVNQGDEGDFFISGRGVGPGFNGFVPNTDSYQNGTIVQTGIVISNFVRNDTVMTFQVTGLGEAMDVIPSNFPTVESNENECLVNVNTRLCDEAMVNVELVEECSCYNFCANGKPQTCAPAGGMPIINCQEGPLIAGCRLELEELPSLNDTTIDLTEPMTRDTASLVPEDEGGNDDSSGERTTVVLRTKYAIVTCLILTYCIIA